MGLSFVALNSLGFCGDTGVGAGVGTGVGLGVGVVTSALIPSPLVILSKRDLNDSFQPRESNQRITK